MCCVRFDVQDRVDTPQLESWTERSAREGSSALGLGISQREEEGMGRWNLCDGGSVDASESLAFPVKAVGFLTTVAKTTEESFNQTTIVWMCMLGRGYLNACPECVSDYGHLPPLVSLLLFAEMHRQQ